MSARRNRSGLRSLKRPEQLPENVPSGRSGRPKASTRALAQVIERSSRVQGSAAEALVARLRQANPGASPAEIVTKLETATWPR